MDYERLFTGGATIAALAGAGAAWQGVNTWREQLIGQEEYQIAKRLLTSVFQMEFLISLMRNPVVDWREEWPELLELKTTLRVQFLEARVAWGNEVFALHAPLSKCIQEFIWSKATEEAIQDGRIPEPERDRIFEEIEPIARVQPLQSDSFLQRLTDSVKPIDDELSRHLRRQRKGPISRAINRLRVRRFLRSMRQ